MPTGDFSYRLTSIPLWGAELVPALASGIDSTRLGDGLQAEAGASLSGNCLAKHLMMRYLEI
jgi:hypothetical protein